jgi:hypothetical protein
MALPRFEGRFKSLVEVPISNIVFRPALGSIFWAVGFTASFARKLDILEV